MSSHYGILTKNGWFYGFDTQKCVGIYVQKRENARTFSTKDKAQKVKDKFGLTGEIANLDK